MAAAPLRTAGAAFEALCARIMATVGVDAGGRGIAHITPLHAQLPRAALHFVLSPSVVVLTGFPCRVAASPPTETDGPPGAIALASAAHALAKSVAIATDDTSSSVMRACLLSWAEGDAMKMTSPPALLSFPALPFWTESDAERLQAIALSYRHAVAIERAGRASDGSYRTMRGIPMDALVAPLDELLTRGCACSGAGLPVRRTSTGIGDGGNECGMGSVYEAVKAFIPRGPEIGCVVPCDSLLTVGVSNWGGWGLVAAAEALIRIASACALPKGTISAEVASAAAAEALTEGEKAVASVVAILARGTVIPDMETTGAMLDRAACDRICSMPAGSLLPSDLDEARLATAMEESGARDGISGAAGGSVDGMPHDTHLKVLAELRDLLCRLSS